MVFSARFFRRCGFDCYCTNYNDATANLRPSTKGDSPSLRDPHDDVHIVSRVTINHPESVTASLNFTTSSPNVRKEDTHGHGLHGYKSSTAVTTLRDKAHFTTLNLQAITPPTVLPFSGNETTLPASTTACNRQNQQECASDRYPSIQRAAMSTTMLLWERLYCVSAS